MLFRFFLSFSSPNHQFNTQIVHQDYIDETELKKTKGWEYNYDKKGDESNGGGKK
jgi:hypothetical protein